MSQYPSRPIVPKGEKRRRVVVDTRAFAFPKDDHYRNPALLATARDQDCTLMFYHGAGHDPKTTVACHSNQATHGKGERIKAHDCYIAYGCANCHHILDVTGSMSRDERDRKFADAMAVTRFRMFDRGIIKPVIGGPVQVDVMRALRDDAYWLELWRDELVRVA